MTSRRTLLSSGFALITASLFSAVGSAKTALQKLLTRRSSSVLAHGYWDYPDLDTMLRDYDRVFVEETRWTRPGINSPFLFEIKKLECGDFKFIPTLASDLGSAHDIIVFSRGEWIRKQVDRIASLDQRPE